MNASGAPWHRHGVNPHIRMSILVAATLWPGAAVAQDAAETMGKQLNEDLQMAAVVHVMPSGDIDLFSGSIIVPARRPSTEKCGIYMAKSSGARSAELKRARSKARDHAIKSRYSPRERHEYTRKATAALVACKKKFSKRCNEVKGEVPLAVRKRAVEVAKKEIEKLPKGPGEKKAIAGYLDNVLAACPLLQ